MDTVISLLVLSTIAQHVAPQVPHLTSLGAVVEVVMGVPRVFSGEEIRLRCSIPDVHKSNWNYLWFKGSQQLMQSGQNLVLWNVKVKDSGKFYCQGVRDTAVGNIYTLQSLPVEINVDGGWAILQVPPHPGLVGDTLQVTCRLKGKAPLHEVILYKDGVEVMRQKSPHFNLTRLTLDDQGMYSCRASWDMERRTHSVISDGAQVQILEVLSQPVLEIVANDNLVPLKRMKLICHLQYNAPAPAPPVHYYFYRNNNRLGTATSENHDLVKQLPGQYSCKAKVPQLGIYKWSEPKSFGQVTGPQMAPPQIPPPRGSQPLTPQVSSPDLFLPPAAEPTEVQPLTDPPSPHQSTAAPAFTQPTEVSTQSSDPPLQPPQPTPSTWQPPVQSVNQTDTTTTDTPFTFSQESDYMSGESGDLPEESGDMSGKSPETVLY